MPLEGTSEKYVTQDPALIQSVATAHLWWQWIREGKVKTSTEIAVSEELDKAQITRRLPLAFLSPRLVEGILAGTQPAGLTLGTLLRKTDLPVAWAEQENFSPKSQMGLLSDALDLCSCRRKRPAETFRPFPSFAPETRLSEQPQHLKKAQFRGLSRFIRAIR